ncbi:membrane protein [Betaproteobacteria bacterium]|nr:membrane protein [Betaproteobacteria bacterium]
MKRPLLLLTLAAAFAIVPALWAVWDHERTLAEGEIVLLELAPVDPRSLMQGDYMALRFAIDRNLDDEADYAWLTLDPERRASLQQTSPALPPPQGVLAMRIRKYQGHPTIGPNAFFFQEGTSERFDAAKWGEFRVAPNGKALLTHLRNEKLERLGENLR